MNKNQLIIKSTFAFIQQLLINIRIPFGVISRGVGSGTRTQHVQKELLTVVTEYRDIFKLGFMILNVHIYVPQNNLRL